MCSLSLVTVVLFLVCSRCFFFLPSNHFVRQNLRRTEKKYRWTDSISKPKQLVRICPFDRFCRVQNLQTSCCCCCFSHSAHWLPTRKKLLYTVANPARGLLNREKKKKKKSGSIERIWPITELYFRQILSTDFINRLYLSVIRQGLRIFQML